MDTSGADDRRERSLGFELGNYLVRFQWDHFVTLTTRTPLTPETIRWVVEREFIRSLARRAQRPVRYFFAVEGGERLGGFHHAHGLVSGTEALEVPSIEQSWKRGFTSIRRYDASRGAAYYVTKELRADRDYYFVSRRMPELLPL
jgi:hypothetical protein